MTHKLDDKSSPNHRGTRCVMCGDTWPCKTERRRLEAEELHRRMHSDAERFWCDVHHQGWPMREGLDAHVREKHSEIAAPRGPILS